ncbi:Homoserine/homoserine lactone efflux protein [Collimonas arenae]|uniref:Homoserine/homoserine lactone efflux protein n=1 Tax=Collimonas arenae TaxID=279058 RepID=A0A0A1F985_9BURK|nr:LysE family translocator [Collimonas arenae]AIY39422.1 Homoserine/homoserine lactone efflux protein [Collimonas arenae]
MSLSLWLSFVAASALVIAIPGPTILLIATHAVSFGPRIAAAMVLGSALGGATAMALAMAGLGVLLTTSTLVFTGLKLLGAAYFIYLGIRMWRQDTKGIDEEKAVHQVSPLKAFCHAFLVTGLNPKGIGFFVLFLPMFIDKQAPYVPQMLILIPTMAVIGMLNDSLYAACAIRLRHVIRRAAVMRRINRAGGAILTGLGIAIAVHRSS